MNIRMEDLIEKHQYFLEMREVLDSFEIVPEILKFLDQLGNAGSDINHPQQRSQLRGLIRFWGSIVYDYTGEYPETKLLPFSEMLHVEENIQAVSRCNFGESLYANDFVGRTEELAQLKEWLINDKCQVISITGIGGIGKSSLARKLVEESRDRFDFIYWRNFVNAPLVSDLAADLIRFLMGTSQQIPTKLEERIYFILQHLNKYRCLVIFDNLETILEPYEFAGQYDVDYEEYGKLINAIGEVSHQSCLLLTSRENPRDIVFLSKRNPLVKILELKGLDNSAAKALLQSRSLQGQDADCRELAGLYHGHPLALRIIMQTITDFFDGDIRKFLSQQVTAFGEIDDLLNEQFTRISKLEQSILYWLAIDREAVKIDSLLYDIFYPDDKGLILGALYSLQGRSLVELTSGQFSLQPVVIEFLTKELIKTICQEILSGDISLFRSHAILKAQSGENIRKSQGRLILDPIIQCLKNHLGAVHSIKHKLTAILATQRKVSPPEPSYVAGNILNLFSHMDLEISGLEFSCLCVWQANLSGLKAHNVDFSYSDLSGSRFSDTLGGVLSLAISLNGNLMAAGSTSGIVHLWDLVADKKIASLEGHSDWIQKIEFSPDCDLLVSCGDDQTLRLWSVNSQECIRTFYGHVGRVWSVVFSPDGKLLASSGDDETIRIWDVQTGESVNILKRHNGPVWALSLSGELLVSGGEDKKLIFWNNYQVTDLGISVDNGFPIRSIDFAPDGKLLAVCGDDQTVRIWDVQSGTCIGVLEGHLGRIRSVNFSPCGKLLASGSEDQTIRLWDVNTNKCIRTLHGHNNHVLCVRFDPIRSILVSASDDTSVRFWDVLTGQCTKVIHGYSNHPVSLSFTSDSTTLASCSDDQSIRIWNLQSGECLGVLEGHSNRVWSVDFSPDGKLLASGSEDKTIRLWDTKLLECAKVLQGHTDLVWPVKFSPKGNVLASGGTDETVRLWSVDKYEQLGVLYGHSGPIWGLAFSPDGKLLASGGDDMTIRLWDIDSRECLSVFTGHSNLIWDIQFSADGKSLASASADGTVKFWNVSSGRCVETLRKHEGQVTSISFSPDNRTIASGSTDHTICLWNIETMTLSTVLSEHTGPIWSVRFSPNGEYLASCGDDETIKLWNPRNQMCLKTLFTPKPYEQMNITGVLGISESQKLTLKSLGAVEK